MFVFSVIHNILLPSLLLVYQKDNPDRLRPPWAIFRDTFLSDIEKVQLTENSKDLALHSYIYIYITMSVTVDSLEKKIQQNSF